MSLQYFRVKWARFMYFAVIASNAEMEVLTCHHLFMVAVFTLFTLDKTSFVEARAL